LGKPASPHATTVIPRKQRLRWATPQTSTLGSYTKKKPIKLQAHHCITPEQWSWLLCSVSAIPVNKMLLQELL